MPRFLPAGLTALLARRDAQILTHSTLQLTFPSDLAPRIDLYFATAQTQILGVNYARDLREVGAVRSSLTRAVDRSEVVLQNVDRVLGVDLLAAQDALYGTDAVIGRYFLDLDTGAEYHVPLLTGVAAGVDISETAARLAIISDVYAAVSVGASRRVVRLCQWAFRGPQCGYSGAELACNFLLNDAGGCQGRHGDPLKRAKFGGFVHIEPKQSVAGAASLPAPPANQLIQNGGGAAFLQQPFTQFVGAAVTNDTPNNRTIVDFSAGSGGGGSYVLNTAANYTRADGVGFVDCDASGSAQVINLGSRNRIVKVRKSDAGFNSVSINDGISPIMVEGVALALNAPGEWVELTPNAAGSAWVVWSLNN